MHMTSKKYFFLVIGIISLLLVAYTNGTAEEKTDGWIYYGTSEDGDHYFDKRFTSDVTHKVFRVYDKVKYSKIGKEKLSQLKQDPDLALDWIDQVDFGINYYQLDCGKSTIKQLKNVQYGYGGEVLFEKNIPSSETEPIELDSMDDLLFKKICPDK